MGARALRTPDFFPPTGNGAAQLEIGHRARQDRQPEGDCAVGEHREHRQVEFHAEGGERSDHPRLDAAQAAGKRQQVSERPDEIGHPDDGEGRRRSECVKRSPQDADVKARVVHCRRHAVAD